MSATAEAEPLAVRAEAAPDRLALAAFAGAVAIGGSNFVAIRFSNRGLDPFWGAGARFALAAAVFGLLFVALRPAVPRGRPLALVAAYGLLAFGGGYGFLYWAMLDVEAGTAAVAMAVGPLLTLLLAAAHGLERLRGRAVAVAVVALAGSAVMFADPGEGGLGPKQLALLAAAALCFSESVVVSKLAAQHPVVMNGLGMAAGAAVLLAASLVAGEELAFPDAGETQAAVAYLVAATIGLFLLTLFVVQRWSASVTAYAFVLMPVVAVALGALVADEEIRSATVLGGLVVGFGVWIGAVRRERRVT
jgi:drug/metabolite transporter (DMT)-like permease